MKTLQDYLAEAEAWMHMPQAGDAFHIELEDNTLLETYIIEVADDCILLDSTPEINKALSEWATLEDTDEGDSGVIMETMGYGGLVGEGQMKQAMHKAAERMTLAQFIDRYGDEDWIREFWNNVNGPVDEDQDAAVVAGKEAAIDAAQRLATDEAKYQGREVQLNKKMAGDVKKFKVYVKDPATGNIKKVNFGHGGKTAKKLGQKTMRIRKSNPAARKNFRARHNCDNPGPKTKARYWSCRNW
jgi:hypothetical protein